MLFATTTHCTATLLDKNRIVLDLTDALRDVGERPTKHLELLFRNCGELTATDLAEVQKTIHYWVLTIGGGDTAIPFELEQDSSSSRYARIQGPLRDLCVHVRNQHNAKRCTAANLYAPHVLIR